LKLHLSHLHRDSDVARIRPALTQLRALADLHIHSTFSDGRLTIPEIVDLYGRQGFAAIAITDHLCETATFLGKAANYLEQTLTPSTFPLYQEILASEAERARREYGMLVVPGFELTKNTILNHRSAHVVALGVTEWISADLSIEEICARIHAQGGLAIAAHPVSTRKLEKQTYYLWNRRDEFAAHFDAWEVASGRKIFTEVLESGLPMIANSDMHRAEQIESWKTVFRSARGTAELRITFDEIRMGVHAQDLEFQYYSATSTSGLKRLTLENVYDDGDDGRDIAGTWGRAVGDRI
jgi:predicted metal-dependent phosphoesterase TrpH